LWNAQLLDTSDARVSTLVGNRFVENTPLNGRFVSGPDLISEAGVGTEVQLTVPVSVASETSRDDRGFNRFRKREKS
jgi:hypothetical protein